MSTEQISALETIRKMAMQHHCFDADCFERRDVDALAAQGGDICDWTMVAIHADDALKSCASPHWVRLAFDPEEPECVRCGTSMYLRDGGEWEDREEYNLCHQCALLVIHEMRSRPLQLEN